MKRNSSYESPIPIFDQELRNRTAYHEAGHAAAIYFLNKLKNLPPVFFQITLKKIEGLGHWPTRYEARIDDGRLIQSLPISGTDTFKHPDTPHKGLLTAFEADIVNLLVGSLAEAKFVSDCDGETINPYLINLEALKFYGGSSDLEIVHEYLDCFISSERQRKLKIKELFLQAFDFIEAHSNWKAISALAKYILNDKEGVITCEEAISVLESA